MQHHTRYLDAKEALLDSIENDITDKVQPVLEAALEKTVDLLEEETAEREAALTPLNDSLQAAIGEVLFMRQREVAELAVQFYPGIPNRMHFPMGEDGHDWDAWFKAAAVVHLSSSVTRSRPRSNMRRGNQRYTLRRSREKHHDC